MFALVWTYATDIVFILPWPFVRSSKTLLLFIDVPWFMWWNPTSKCQCESRTKSPPDVIPFAQICRPQTYHHHVFADPDKCSVCEFQWRGFCPEGIHSVYLPLLQVYTAVFWSMRVLRWHIYVYLLHSFTYIFLLPLMWYCFCLIFFSFNYYLDLLNKIYPFTGFVWSMLYCIE